MDELKKPTVSTSKVNESGIENKETDGLNQRQIIVKRFFKHKAAVVSLITLISIFVIVYTSLGITVGFSKFKFSIPGWWPYNISQIDPEGAVASTCNGGVTGCPTLDLAPSFLDGDGVRFGAHPLGTDIIGTDYFALVMRGAQQSILVMLIVGILGIVIGTVIGAIAGYFGGVVDSVLLSQIKCLR